MELLQAIQERHSVRSYETKPIEGAVKDELLACIEECNRDSGLHIQLILNEPKAFSGPMAHYGKFSGVEHYIALVGKKWAGLEERCGYYGEKIVLRAQQLGLNTCWVALTYSKTLGAVQVGPGEKLALVIAIGYGKTQGVAHTIKTVESVSKASQPIPEWFTAGVEAALLAPTAMNQQKFVFTLEGSQVSAKAGLGFYTKVDLGIAKYHFEIGAGTGHFQWK